MVIDMHSHVAGGFSEKFAHEWVDNTHFGHMPAWFKERKENWKAEDLTKFWADRYVEEMDKNGIDKVVTWGIVMRPYDCRSTVEEVAAIVPIEVYKEWKGARSAFFDKIKAVSERANLPPKQADRLAEKAVHAVRSSKKQ